MVTEEKQICATYGCGKPASLQCPTCQKLGLSTHFCSQECFKGFWGVHKSKHDGAALPDKFKGYSFFGKLRPGKISPKRAVPGHIVRPDYADTGIPLSEQKSRASYNVEPIKPEDIPIMREACRIGREILDIAGAAAKVGMTTDEIDWIVHEATIARNAYPSPLNYREFPKSCCTSVNEIICHGIPDSRPLENGDIVNIDVSAYYKGFHTDLNETFLIGDVDEKGKLLVKTTHDALNAAIDIVKPGVMYREVGEVISRVVHKKGFSVVKAYCGHGVGTLFHGPPNIPHYARNKAVGVMKAGHVFTIEPMINEGVWQDETWPDNWTSCTADGKRSAQFEHTILVTDTGCEVLTARTKGSYIDRFV